MIQDIYAQNPLLFIALAVLAFITIIQLIYYWSIYGKVAFFRQKNEFVRSDQGVSVIVCARDEYHNLKENLPLLLAQDYSQFEVVVVNHGSEDETNYLLRDLAEVHKNLKIVNVPQDLNFFTGKKFPLSIGIKSASYEILLFTDADCVPASNQWLRRMAANFTEGTEIVLGYGAYSKSKSLLNLLIRFDTTRIAMNYLGFARAGMPYMGVGRNMAYRKSLFYRQNGFISHYRIQSGDDDLFINKAATDRNTRIEIQAEALTISKPKTSLDQWIRQKRRHLQTGSYYKPVHKFVLGLFAFTQTLYWALAITLLVLWYQPYVVLGIIGLRLFTQLLVTGKVMKKLSETGFLLLVPFFELFLMIISPILAFANLLSKPVKWR
ncbi:MAG TPA: glycosyltransferase [Bacteroidales bacterium]|nr:glycosyltransferase [Bacteroidales bacterium]